MLAKEYDQFAALEAVLKFMNVEDRDEFMYRRVADDTEHLRWRDSEKYASEMYVSTSILGDPDWESLVVRTIDEVRKRALFGFMDRIVNDPSGVNVRILTHAWVDNNYFGNGPVIIRAVCMMRPVTLHEVKYDMVGLSMEPHVWYCLFCGARMPDEDKFHSGTCENCGGPLP